MGVLWMFVMLASCIMDRITIKNFKTGALRADLRMTWKPPVAAKSLGRRRGSGLGEHTAEANQNNAHPLDNAAVLEEPGHRKSERQHELELAIDAVAQRAQEVQHAAHEDVHPRRQGPAHEDDDLGAGGEAAEGHERLDALSDLCHGDHDGEAPDGGPRRQAERTLALLLGNRGSTPSSGSGTGTPRGPQMMSEPCFCCSFSTFRFSANQSGETTEAQSRNTTSSTTPNRTENGA
ncbi:unnamed protein product, partial [Prorocentrum cordatum]